MAFKTHNWSLKLTIFYFRKCSKISPFPDEEIDDSLVTKIVHSFKLFPELTFPYFNRAHNKAPQPTFRYNLIQLLRHKSCLLYCCLFPALHDSGFKQRTCFMLTDNLINLSITFLLLFITFRVYNLTFTEVNNNKKYTWHEIHTFPLTN